MSQVIIELNESKEVLGAVRDLLTAIIGDDSPAAQNDTPPPAAQNDTELDSEGTPWDSRIHASNKSKIQSGAWRRRRGVEDGEYERVLAEIKGAEPDTASIGFGEPEPQQAPSASEPQQQPPAAAPGASISPGGVDWPTFMQRLQGAKQSGTYNDAMMQQIMQRNGIAAVPLFAQRSDLWDDVLSEMMI